MAGKSNKVKNRKESHAPANSSQLPLLPDPSADDSPNVTDLAIPVANGADSGEDSTIAASEIKETEPANLLNPPRQEEGINWDPIKRMGVDKVHCDSTSSLCFRRRLQYQL